MEAPRTLSHLDRAIQVYRKLMANAETIEESMRWLLMSNLAQRERMESYGSFLPASDGFVYLYDGGMGYWSRWKSVVTRRRMIG